MNLSDYLKQAAENLNAKVRDFIDPRLFLFCNFEANDLWVLGADALFVVSVQNLYKFAVDSSCILKNYRDFLDPSRFSAFQRLQQLLDQISMLRAVIDHNQSSQDGWLEQKRLEDYDNWVREIIRKDRPTTAEDFSLLNRTLTAIAAELVQQAELFVSEVAGSSKPALIEKWIGKTLRWYVSNTKTEIYKGQLISAYIANAHSAGMHSQALSQSRAVNRKVKKWLEAAIFHPIDRRLDEIDSEIAAKEAALNPNSPLYRAYQAKLPADAFTTIIGNMQQGLQQLQNEKNQLTQQQNTLQQRVGSNCWDYYFKQLEAQLRSTMAQLESDGISYTLLPQDLLQEDIAIHFGDVPSPEGDF